MVPGSVLAAMGLASGWMLLWGAAAAIPLIIHLINRRQQNVVRWAAMQLLQQVIEQQARKVRFEQLLLLAIRMLILVVLGIALARPFFGQSAEAVAIDSQEPPRLWIVAIDASYSMQYGADGKTRFEMARARAAEIVQSGRPGDAFSIVMLSRPARAVIARPSFDRDGTLAELMSLKSFDTGANLGETLRLIRDIADEAQQSAELPQDCRVHILSDLGRDTWEYATSGRGARELEELMREYPVKIESFAEQTTENRSITELKSVGASKFSSESLSVLVRVENYDTVPRQRVPLRIELNGQTVSTEYVDLPAKSSRLVESRVVMQGSGLQVITAGLPEDRLMVDNTRHMVVESRQQTRILIIESRPGVSKVVRLALKPDQRGEEDPYIETAAPFRLLELEGQSWDLVILSDVAALPTGAMEQMQSFVRQGGSIVGLFGGNTDPAMWNAVASGNSSLLGFEFQQPSALQDWRIDARQYASPIVAPFRGFPDAGLLTTPLFRYWQVERESSEFIVDLAIESGDPLLVRNRLGEGWFISLLSSPQTGSESGLVEQNREGAWNAMATWPSFVPLMRQIVQVAMNSGMQAHNLICGEPIAGSYRASAMPGQVMITLPNGAQRKVTAGEVDTRGNALWQFGETFESGVYQGRPIDAERDLQTEPYAVNLLPVESDLGSVDLKRMESQGQESEQSRVTKAAADSAAEEHKDFWARILLIALAILLVSESMLGWSMGRRLA